jgi:uncharacterized protein YdhG (YjbR/CyaY superfamily)
MKEVDMYLSELSETERVELLKIRATVKKIVPNASEIMGYGMPGFKYKDQYLIGYAAFKNHLSIFPTSWPIEAMHPELVDFKTSKGTIQFSKKKPITEDIVSKLVRLRVEQINGD